MLGLDFPVRFDAPAQGLLGLVLGGVAVILFFLSYKRLRIAQKHLELVEWRQLRRIVRMVNVFTKAGVVIALAFLLARPYFPIVIEVPVNEATDEQIGRYSVATVLLMDVSYSMNYSDLKPTRLDFSKNMIKLLINKTSSRDLVGFISFANYTYNTIFPTVDRKEILERINNQTVHPSTAIGTALATAVGVLETFPSGRAIVLFSDGKNNAGANVISAVVEAAALKIPIFTVSLGTYGLGEADPLALREISGRTGGKFYEARNEDIENLGSSISQISREVKVGALKAVYDRLTIPSRDYQTPTVFFSAFLVASLLLTWFTGV